MNQSKSVAVLSFASRSIATACAIIFVWHLASLAQLVLQVRTGEINIVDGFPRIVAPFCIVLGATIGYKWSMIGRTFLVISAGLSLIAVNSGPPIPAKYWSVFVLSVIALVFLEYRQAKRRAET